MTEDLTARPWRTTSSRLAYTGWPASLYEDHTLDAAGTARTRHRLIEPDSTRVVAVDADTMLQLVWRWRYQLGYPALELPSAELAPGEHPLTAARRALADCCGLTAKVWVAAGRVIAATAVAGQTVHLYRAAGLTPVRTPAVDPELAALPMPYEVALAAVKAGGIQDAASVAALLRAEQQRLAGDWHLLPPAFRRPPAAATRRLQVVR